MVGVDGQRAERLVASARLEQHSAGLAHALAEVDPREVRCHRMPIIAVHQTEPAGLQLLQRLGFDLFEKLLGREALELAIVEGDEDVGGLALGADR